MRIRKILAMSLCFLAIIGLLVVCEYLDVAFIDSQSVTTIDELKNDGLVKEVNSCLPTQRCAENNSVNSAKICCKRWAQAHCFSVAPHCLHNRQLCKAFLMRHWMINSKKC